jgi:hypothetical protein
MAYFGGGSPQDGPIGLSGAKQREGLFQTFEDASSTGDLEITEELMREARKWHLQRRLRASREQHSGTRPLVDSRKTGTGVIEIERPRQSIRALALGLSGRRNSYGSTSH